MKKVLILLIFLITTPVAHAACTPEMMNTGQRDPDTGAVCITVRPASNVWTGVGVPYLQGTQQVAQYQQSIPANPCGNPSRPGNLTYCPLEPFYAGEKGDINSGNFASIIENVFRILIGVGALIAVVTMVIGGIMYMTTEVTGTKEEAKHRMLNSIFGLVLLGASVLILNTINPNLTIINIQPGAIVGNQRVTTPQPQNAALTNVSQADINDCVISPNGQPSGRAIYTLSTGGFECR